MTLIEKLSEHANFIRNKTEIYKAGDQEIEVKPITNGELIEISPYLAQIQIEGDITTAEEFHEKAIPQLDKYTEPLRYIIEYLYDCDYNSLLPIDSSNLLLATISSIQTTDFITSIILINKISRNSREIIARAEQNYLTQ